MIKPFVKLVKALCSNTNPSEIAHAFACGMLLGFMPKDNLLWYIIFIAFYFLRIQRSVLTLSLLLGTLFAPLLDNVFNALGNFILTRQSLFSFYQWLLNIPFMSFTKFNNTVVIGSFVFGLIAYIPFFALARFVTYLFRKYAADGFNKWKLVKVIKQLPMIEKIAKISGEA
jgi:uncharacterized protein (TIGR03546 family)